MRYRPIGRSGAIISSVSLALESDAGRARAGDWTALVYAALENGINGFQVIGSDDALADGLRQAFSAVDRSILFVCWRVGRSGDFSATALGDEVREALAASDLNYLDGVMLEDPSTDLSDEAVETLLRLRSAGLVRFVGVAGDSDATDAHVGSGRFDLLATRYNLTSGWRERHRLRTAGASDMAVIGSGYYPNAVSPSAVRAPNQKLPSLPKGDWRDPLSGCGTYAFLEETQGWKADEICLAYALTEPSLASVQIETSSIGELERLAAVVERDMPPGVAAQIEMARFSPQEAAQARRHA